MALRTSRECPKMSTTYRFFSFSSVYFAENTSTERLFKVLRLVQPSLPDFVASTKELRSYDLDDASMTRLMMRGLYCLYEGEILRSALIINTTHIDRVITPPRFRKQGYASRLIKEFARQTHLSGLHTFAPVEPEIEPLFVTLGWIRSDFTNPDGTHDFYPPESKAKYLRSLQIEEDTDVTEYLHHLSQIVCRL